ncbi:MULTISPECIES: MEDS domain-containing protein [Metabacillus]|uniref:MEDS domain-containing protein n=1 Tax=Metabacillus elymi TaxID=2745198 RepID=A0ABX6S8Q9_9BACI|nr:MULTISPECIES: MEDS domain-containing protein [Metabacillus]QNF29766.1 MEDS domain-containing protein [Metabacillus sp. KUDC1714]
MDKKVKQLLRDLQQSTCYHIFYSFNDLERYLENAISYILSGIEQGDYVFVIENERIFPLLYKKIEPLLTKVQLDKIKHVNNFDFYCSNGDFHPPTIVAYFSNMLEIYIEKNASIRTWAHVEWGDLQEITCKIEEFEQAANKAVQSMKIISVCAYDEDRLTESLKASLISSHEYTLTDSESFVLIIDQ